MDEIENLDFSGLRVRLASPEDILSFQKEKLQNLKQLTIELSDLKKMVYLMKEFLALQKIMNVIVESIKELDTKESSVIDVELK